MRLELKDFQDVAVERLYRHARRARDEVIDGDPQALVLAAPTGSGKTVIATRLMEVLLTGDGMHAGDEEASFLWISDQPELNEQTRRKILETSDVFTRGDLVTIDSSFNKERLEAGKVYFLNTQKLGRDRKLVTYGDERQFTLWDTVTNTAEARPQSFWVVIDEAHRGTFQDEDELQQAQALVQRFILGFEEMPPAPLIIGISATPGKFQQLLTNTTRLDRIWSVDPADVRASGLLKERVLLHHPKQALPADITLLERASRQLAEYNEAWQGYAAAQGAGEEIRPLLVVQVEDASGDSATATPLAEALQAIEGVLGDLSEDEVAHCFQETHSLEVEERTIRRIAPVDIQDDSDLRVVFFKRNLNTGWDCPRAEVMMSFRRAVDYTSIAQLVGRMVRTPLARRVESNEVLNSVSLYLPRFDAEAVGQVVTYLTEDPDDLVPLDVDDGDEIVTLVRSSELEDFVGSLEALPTYSIQRVNRWPSRRRLMRLARELVYDEIDKKALDRSRTLILDALLAEYEHRSESEDFKAVLEGADDVDISAIEYAYGTTETREVAGQTVTLARKNIDDLFAATGRLMTEGLHLAFLKKRVDGAGGASKTKLELFALLQDESVLKTVEDKCGAEVERLLKKHRAKLRQLPDARAEKYQQIRRTAVDPQPGEITLPEVIQAKLVDTTWPDHLYVDSEARYPAALNTWETKVINQELAREDVVGWLRNPPRKPWSISIPYRSGGQDKALYPDFLILREDEGGQVVDLVDPHTTSLSDAWPKAIGLAEYADKHAHEYGRIELVMVERDEVRRLDLTDVGMRGQVKNITTNEQLKALFRGSAS
ncbi:MAG: DEAD/DEAH box helicase family protein [Gaiellaceae bacterium]